MAFRQDFFFHRSTRFYVSSRLFYISNVGYSSNLFGSGDLWRLDASIQFVNTANSCDMKSQANCDKNPVSRENWFDAIWKWKYAKKYSCDFE